LQEIANKSLNSEQENSMPDGASIAAASMRAESARLDSVSANLANMLTPGYKRQLPATTGQFIDLVNADFGSAQSSAAPSIDFKPGPLRNTGNALDLAIEGDAFFELSLDGQNFYTRQGNFMLDAQGRLQTADGATVQGVSGDIKLESANARVDAQGRVFEGDTQVAQLRLVRFDQVTRLRSVDNVRFVQGQAEISAMGDATRANVRQGFVEASNVVTAEEMVRLMESMRRFEGGQRVILWFGEMGDQVRQRLGEF
jgi:flagellar basal-body rod protein FlgF